nr:ATP-binding protein [Pseudomonas poae]
MPLSIELIIWQGSRVKIQSLKVKNFRTIRGEQTLNLTGGLTLVGPNNAGKTNALMAIYMFFTGYENLHKYEHSTDFSSGDKSVKTSLTCHFRGDSSGKDKDIFEKLDKLRVLLGHYDPSDEFSINVYFNGNNPVYQVYPGLKRPAGKSPQCSMAQKAFIQAVLDSFKCYYIPSKKSIDELYDEFVSPFIRMEVATALRRHIPEIQLSVAEIATSMNTVLKNNGLGQIQVAFKIPNGAITDLITGFDLAVKDPESSSIYSKGMGVQAAVLLSSFKWITQQQRNVNVVWLIEEPETYMHPRLAERASRILDDLGEISTLIKTTHAINFVPTNIKLVQGVRRTQANKATSIIQYASHRDATESIRKSLGVKFADYFALSKYNLFVEGETDRTYIDHVWRAMQPEMQEEYPYLSRTNLLIKDFTGVSDLKGFLKSNFGLLEKEVCIVSLFDGDKAGVDAVREMGHYCANKDYKFNSNVDYVLISGGHPIEGLFPPDWIIGAFEHEPAWFEGGAPIVDSDGGLVEFKIRDGSKKTFMKYILELYDDDRTYDSSEGFFKLFEKINGALELKAAKLDLAL